MISLMNIYKSVREADTFISNFSFLISNLICPSTKWYQTGGKLYVCVQLLKKFAQRIIFRIAKNPNGHFARPSGVNRNSAFSAGSGCGIYGLSFGADTIITRAQRAVFFDEKNIEKGLDKSDILCYNKYMQIISCR